MKTTTSSWFTETHSDFFRQGYRIKEVLFSSQSEFQTVAVIDTYGHGRMLINDGFVMISERDEFVYHEMIVHVPLQTHPQPKSVLIVGGGDGGTAREVLKHQSVEKCVMVEIDLMVVEVCKKYLPLTASCLDHPKLELRIEDAVKYMARSQETFDVILIDSTDPIGPAKPLFGKEFYQNVYNRLNKNGIVVSQGESSYYEVKIQTSMLEILKSLFPITQIYTYSNLTYPGGLWAFTFASKGLHPLKDIHDKHLKGLKYYNLEIHKSAFVHPQFMKDQLNLDLTQKPK